MVDQVPVGVVDALIFESPRCVFAYVRPFLFVRKFVKEHWVFSFKLGYLFNLLIGQSLAALVLHDVPLKFSGRVPHILILLKLEHLLKLLVELLLPLLINNFRNISNRLLKCSLWINVLVGELRKLGGEARVFVPEAVLLVVERVVLHLDITLVYQPLLLVILIVSPEL